MLLSREQPTSKEQSYRRERPMLSLESLQQRRKRQQVQKRMKKSLMDKRVRIQPVH